MSRPNVLVLLTDQQQAATVDPGSPCQTPNVDRLRTGGTTFSRCYTCNPICSPSRASLFTGELPHTHGLFDVTTFSPTAFDTKLTTWSETLHDSGYHTGYFGKWHITTEIWDREEKPDLERFGFDEHEVLFSTEFDRSYAAFRRDGGLPERAARDPDDLVVSRTVSHPGYDEYLLYGTHEEPEGTVERYLYDRGIEFVRRAADRSEPWCLVVSTPGPHDPYVAPHRDYERYDIDGIPQPPSFHDSMDDKPGVYRRLRAVWDDLTWEDYAAAIACYYASCTHIDEQVGRLLDVLEETGQDEETVVIYTSDHGDYMGEHGLFLKGVPAFEAAYRVPLVIRWPDADFEAEVCTDPVQLHDLAPTMEAISAGAQPHGTDTSDRVREADVDVLDPDRELPAFEPKSLLSFLAGSRPDGYVPEAYAEFHGNVFTYTQRTYWFGRYKYVFNAFADDELYDLETDPDELENCISREEFDDVQARLAGRLWEIARESGDRIADVGYPTTRLPPVGPDWRR